MNRSLKADTMKIADMTLKVELDINASPEKVWEGLTKPEAVKQYMMGAKLDTDWKEGSPITWKGEYKGKPFEDKGQVLHARKPEHLAYSHISPGSGEADKPENQHNVDIRLARAGKGTRLTLTQDNNPTEEAKAESEKNWKMMLEGLKKVVEQ